MRQIEDSNTPSGKENNENLKRSTILSLLWNAFDKVGFQLIAFLIGLVTLRLLSPRDFGLIGALAIFTALSNIFVESGFSSAMIRRKDNKDNEYVALLIFHLTLALLFYGGLFFSAEYIASYYKMPELKDLSRFLFLSIIFNSISIVHIIILTKQLSFKLLSIASLAGAIVGGVVVIVMILNGYTYWALAWQIVLQCAVKCLVLWASCKWFPNCKPDFRIVKELFKFSCSILATSLTNTFVRYIYNPIIGRAFGEAELGYYTQAQKFYNLPTSIISSSISGVSYPVLSKLNDDQPKQVKYLQKMIRICAFGIFPVLIGAMACFENIITIILTEKWLPIVPYFQILSIAGLVMPFQNLYNGLFTLKGKPQWTFVIECIKNACILIPLFFIKDTHTLLWSFSAATLFAYFISLFFVKKIIGYSPLLQLRDILPYLFLSLVMATIVILMDQLSISLLLKLPIQIIGGAATYIAGCYLCGSAIVKEMVNQAKVALLRLK